MQQIRHVYSDSVIVDKIPFKYSDNLGWATPPVYFPNQEMAVQDNRLYDMERAVMYELTTYPARSGIFVVEGNDFLYIDETKNKIVKMRA